MSSELGAGPVDPDAPRLTLDPDGELVVDGAGETGEYRLIDVSVSVAVAADVSDEDAWRVVWRAAALAAGSPSAPPAENPYRLVPIAAGLPGGHPDALAPATPEYQRRALAAAWDLGYEAAAAAAGSPSPTPPSDGRDEAAMLRRLIDALGWVVRDLLSVHAPNVRSLGDTDRWARDRLTEDQRAALNAVTGQGWGGSEAWDSEHAFSRLLPFDDPPAPSPAVVSPPSPEQIDPLTEACPTCNGEGCEEGCGNRPDGCDMAHAGPDSHRVCSACKGWGRRLIDPSSPPSEAPQEGER